MSTSVVKWSEVLSSMVSIIIRRYKYICIYIYIYRSYEVCCLYSSFLYHIHSYFVDYIFYMWMYVCMLLCNFANYVNVNYCSSMYS